MKLLLWIGLVVYTVAAKPASNSTGKKTFVLLVIAGMPQKSSFFSCPATKRRGDGGSKGPATKKKNFFKLKNFFNEFYVNLMQIP